MLCPDCRKPLEQIPDLDETIFRCKFCKCEYDYQDLVQEDPGFAWNPEDHWVE